MIYKINLIKNKRLKNNNLNLNKMIIKLITIVQSKK